MNQQDLLAELDDIRRLIAIANNRFTRIEDALKKANAVASGSSLTKQESVVTKLAQQGLTNASIAAQMNLSERTVEAYLQKIFQKLGVKNRTQLLAVR